MDRNSLLEEKKCTSLDPRTKILLMLIVTTIMTTGSSIGIMYYIRFATLALPFLLLIIKCKIYHNHKTSVIAMST